VSRPVSISGDPKAQRRRGGVSRPVSISGDPENTVVKTPLLSPKQVAI